MRSCPLPPIWPRPAALGKLKRNHSGRRFMKPEGDGGGGDRTVVQQFPYFATVTYLA